MIISMALIKKILQLYNELEYATAAMINEYLFVRCLKIKSNRDQVCSILQLVAMGFWLFRLLTNIINFFVHNKRYLPVYYVLRISFLMVKELFMRL